MSFSLSKWYLDVVQDDGALAIGYAARLSLGPLAIDYASLLACDVAGAVTTRTTLRRIDPPTIVGREVAWSAPPLGFSATLHGLDPSIEETLLANDDGKLTWTCHAPCAEVSATIDGRTLHGLGYAEHVALTIPPWRLPIRELRWGRALAQGDSLVWIDWRGEDFSTHLAVRSGTRLEGFVVDEHGLRTDEGVIVTLGDSTTLREGAIGRTALGMLGREVLDLVPRSALLLDEHKWRSRAQFASGARGFAIHEVVRWP